jgi:hypothetical protein
MTLILKCFFDMLACGERESGLIIVVHDIRGRSPYGYDNRDNN